MQRRQPILADVGIPARRRALDACRRQYPDVVHQARESALVLRKSIALGVQSHGV
jgi:hypothetical protein